MTMINILHSLPGRIIGGFLAIGFVFGGFMIHKSNQIRQARFTVDVLEQYLQASRLVGNKPIEGLSELPEFHLISPSDSLSLKSRDLKQGIKNGYVYDLRYSGDGKFVISASPVGLWPIYEFGITQEGILRMNSKGVDADADSYEEVEKWAIITRQEQVRSRDLPAYLR